MEERRRSKRSNLASNIILKRLDEVDEDVEIEIVDVSKSGVGFICKEPLQIGAVYESFLTIWTKEIIHAFLHIVRIEMNEDNTFTYGASFVGLPELDASRIDMYQKFHEEN